MEKVQQISLKVIIENLKTNKDKRERERVEIEKQYRKPIKPKADSLKRLTKLTNL